MSWRGRPWPRLGLIALGGAAMGCDQGTLEAEAQAAELAETTAATAEAIATDAEETVEAEAPAPAKKGPVHWPESAPLEPSPVAPLDGDHIYSRSRHLWIRPEPRESGSWLGYLSLGDAIRVKGGDAESAKAGPGTGRWCQTWYAVEPVGFVCTGELATLDADDPTVQELRRRAADRRSPWPYHYGESLDAPVYLEPPTAKVQRGREYALDAHFDKLAEVRKAADEAAVAAIDERLVGVDLAPAGKTTLTLLPDMPPHGRPNQDRIHIGSTLAWVDSFDHAGRAFLVTWDGGIVPKDKVRPYPELAFHGVILGRDAELPIAFMRVQDQPQLRRSAEGFEPTGEAYARLSSVGLTGEEVEHEGGRFLKAKDGHWLKAGEAAIARAATELPSVIASKSGRVTWLDVSILGGTLVAYEGLRPVYATMISPGRGGIPRRDVPTLETASTPTGTFSVLGKFVTATMQSSSIATLIHSEVNYTMNFSGPYAVHGAYWHDRFGEPKSGGCVNLAPIDAQRIFEWSEPRLPRGWHGMRTLPQSHDFGRPTFVHLRR